MATAIAIAAAAAGASLSGPAAAAPREPDATLVMRAGGDRTASGNNITGGTVDGPGGVRFTVTNAGGTEVGTCLTTAPAGTCSVDVPNGATYTVTRAVPGGWYASENPAGDLGVGLGSAIVASNYSRVTVPAAGGTMNVPAAGTLNNTNNLSRSGVWAASRVNPPEPARCGLNVALLFDLSGSIAPYIDEYKSAGGAFIQALEKTPSKVALYTFAGDAPANTTNNANYPLTSVTTPTDAAPLLTRISGFTASGGTNWDRGIWQIAADDTATSHYDVAIVLTDGNPTYFATPSQGPGSRTRFTEIENGIFSANALKLRATRIIAVGIGLPPGPGSAANLRAISGTTAGSDYIETSFADLKPVLEKLALANCAGIKIEKFATPASYDTVGQQVRYTYTVTNTGEFFTLDNVHVTDDRIPGPVTCAPSTLAPGAVATCHAVHAITQADLDAGHVTNAATATGTTPNDDPVTSLPADQTVHALQHPGISIVKSASVHSFDAAGLLITYYFRVTNTGNVTLTPSVTDSQGLVVTCPYPELAPGREMTCTAHHVTTEADVDAGRIRDVGTATATAPDGERVTDDDLLDIPDVHAPWISIVKLASVDSFDAASTPVTYYYLVTNNGDVPLNQVAVTDSRGLAVSCPSTSLAVNQVMTCTASHTTTQADVTSGAMSNTGTASGRAPDGTEVTDDNALAIPAVHAPEISIVKSASVGSFDAAGTSVTYYYLVTNNGNVPLHQVMVTDSRGLAVSCPSASLALGQVMTCRATYTTTPADVTRGAIANVGTASGRTPGGAQILARSAEFLPFVKEMVVPVTG